MPTDPNSAIIVRPLETDNEIEQLFRLGIESFAPHAPVESNVNGWRESVTRAPGFRHSHLRGAFREGGYLGGYLFYERWMHVGSSRLLTGCISTVVTRPEHRRQGVATALLNDAIAYARARRYDLLLLDGIAGFYHRFGFVDVLDMTEHRMAVEQILAQPASPYTVREATMDDARAMLDLYHRHYGRYVGSFERSLAEQEHDLRGRLRGRAPALAVSPEGKVRGYLFLGRYSPRSSAIEVAADDWPAALALAQHQARLASGPPIVSGTESPDAPPGKAVLCWPLPPDSPIYYLLAEHLEIDSRTHNHPNAGWMARVVSPSGLAEAMDVAWNERWRSRQPKWSGVMTLSVDGPDQGDFTLELTAEGVRRIAVSQAPAPVVRLTQQALVQLVFGYRPVAWLARQPGQSIPGELVPVLDVLFPVSQAWVAGTDSF